MSKVMDFYPLSPMQEGMLFHSLLEPGSGVYVKQITHSLKGELNIPALDRAWKNVVDRHSILRTFFLWENLEKPVQVVQPELNVALHHEDWRGLSEAELERRLGSYLEADRTSGFEFSSPPLARMALIRLADDAYSLVWTWHHILLDGWSEGLLVKEIFDSYNAYRQGRDLRLPRPHPFRDYINWLQQQDLSMAEAFWRRALRGFTEPITLGRQLSKEEIQRQKQAHERNGVIISKQATIALQSFARSHHFTLNTVVQGAWALILSRYSDRKDVVFGAVVSGRPSELVGVESMVGLFVNTLPVRIRIDPEAELLSWFSELQTSQAEALRYDYSPLSQVQKWSEAPPGTPLFESLLAFENFSLDQFMPSQMNQDRDAGIIETRGFLQISYPLSIVALPGPQLVLGMSYDRRRFGEDLIDWMLRAFEALLESFVANPERVLSAFLSDIGPAPTEQPHPLEDQGPIFDRSNLTRNQFIIWLGQKLYPDAPLYNIIGLIRLSNSIEPDHFRKAFRTLINSSDALRTVIEEVDGIPHQRVMPNLDYKIEEFDFSQDSDSDAKFQTWLRNRCQTLFDLEKRLFDSALIKISEREFVFYFNAHHLITDAWSNATFIRLLLHLYHCSLRGDLQERIELAQFKDYVEYERKFRLSPQYQEAESYWQRELAESVESLDFYGRPSVKKTTEVETLLLDLGPERTRRLEEMAGGEAIFLLSPNLSLFSVFVSLLATYLYRITGTSRFWLGLYFHNRRRYEDLIGLLMHIHPLRVTLQEGDTFVSLIKRVQSSYLSILKYREYPISNSSRKPVYDVLLNYIINAPFPSQVDGTPVVTEWLHTGHGLESLNIEIYRQKLSGNFWVSFGFHKDVFNERKRTEAIGHFLQIIDSFLQESAQLIARAKLLTDREKERLLVEFNRTNGDYRLDSTVITRFENQVEQTPDKIAIQLKEQTLTYWELNARANQLAHYLRRLGVGPETLVGLCAGRSLELGVGMLGILKAGAAFVPCDPAYPKDRLDFMVDDSGAEVLLTLRSLAKNFPQRNTKIICLDSDWEVISTASRKNLVSGVAPDNLAYVIYTSGSTGKPKGTMIQHGSLADYNETAGREYGVTAQDRVLQFCSLSFDISIEEIIPCLTYGATLVFRTDAMLESVPIFLQTCHQWNVTLMSLPTAFWHELTDGIDTFALPTPGELRLVIIAGEKIIPEKLATWQRRAGRSPRLVNTYGLTESTIISTALDLTTLTLHNRESREAPIGCPIRNTQLYVLDKNLEPVPAGMPGELYIGGFLLARGYYRRPDVTADRFIPNSFSNEPGARLYKTGDLAKFCPENMLEFIGRSDRQIKIQGFRVELEEVAAVLRRNPVVRDCAVVLREDSPGQKRLVAYVAPYQQPWPTTNLLQDFLRQSLPNHMLPSAFVMLETLPLSPNGKVDYRALPAPDREGAQLEESYVAPRTALEKELAEIWASVLGIDRVGIHDNYFNLGGDSIRSIQMRAKGEQRGLYFTIQQLFQHQTIEQLAQVCVVSSSESSKVQRTTPFSLVSEADRRKMPDDVEDAYQLARLQAGMVFHNLYNPGFAAYQNISTIHLELPYDEGAMRSAIHQVICRHAVLRTSFDLSGYSEPLQLVWKSAAAPFVAEDISHLNAEEQDRIIDHWIKAERERTFDLAQAPLMRFHLHRRTETTFQFSWTEHHAILDGWSMATLLTELFQLYLERLTEDQRTISPPPTVTYRDFIALEREALNSEEARQYWSNKLEGFTITPLPRRPSSGPRQKTPEVRTRSLLPSLEVCNDLKRLAASVGLPVKSFALAAYMRVLSLVCGQSDVTAGLVQNARPDWEDGDRVLGLFANTLPLRLNMSGGSWIDLVQRTFEAEREMMPFRRLPIAEIQRTNGGQPLFETIFNFTHFHVLQTIPRASGAHILGTRSLAATNFVFVVDCTQDLSSSQLQLSLSYDASLIDDARIEAMSKYYLRALEAMIESPYKRYELMPVLSPEEWNQIVEQWNNTAVNYHPEKHVQELFEEQVESCPDAIAVFYEGKQLTYRDLNRRANRLANHLKVLGVGPDKLVGVAAERSVELVVALFGILKAGGAYVPLDPSYPIGRLEFMLADSGVSILLTQSHLLSRLPEPEGRLLCLDRDWPLIAAASAENPESAVTAENSVYMIYTSGSTGRPKGAINTHCGLENRLVWMQQQYQLTPADRVLQKTPFSFDVSVWEFFWPLMIGATLVVARPGGHQESAYLIELIREAQITTLHFVPSMLQAFLDESGVKTCGSLRLVISSGEALTYELQDRFFERMSAQLHNLYGPTEASIDVTYWECRAEEKAPPPIGRPIANTEIYLLDSNLQPAPVGVSGELYIGGVGLARGYHRRPELTAQMFIPNPFCKGPAGRLYRTGDLGRYRPDGNIEYLGRRDHQVKIRGFRIEPGEIEAVLRDCANIKELLVEARETTLGENRLVAYVTYDQEPPPTISEMRKFLRQRLPDYMTPAAFVMMEKFPLTPNGKIDRRALPTIYPRNLESERAFVAPRDPLELRLASLWEDLFNIHPIGVEDNFFDLGGHSILAVRLIAKVHQEFGQALPLSILMEGGAISHLAEALRRGPGTHFESTVVPIQRSGGKPPFFCVHSLGGHVLRFYDLARKLGRDQPFYGIQGRDLADVEDNYMSIEQMAEFYVRAMRETQPTGPYCLGGFSFGSFVAFEMAQQLVRSGQEVALLVLLDTWSPLIVRQLPEFDKDARLLSVMAREMALRSGKKEFDLPMNDLEELQGDPQLSFFFDQVKKGGLVDDEISDEVGLPYIRRLMRGIRTRGAAMRNYDPAVYPGKITFIRCLEQDALLINMWAQAGVDIDDPSSGWAPLSTEPVETHFVTGYHERMMNEPTVSEVAKILNECIEKTQSLVMSR